MGERKSFEELLSQLNATERYRVMTALRGPDAAEAKWTKGVFTGRIRYLTCIPTGYQSAVRRDWPLNKQDVSYLYNEVAKWLGVAERGDEFGEFVRSSFGHFFVHAEEAMGALGHLSSSFITKEEQWEAMALAGLAGALKHRFVEAKDLEGKSVSLLKQGVRNWLAVWYPEWGEDWLPSDEE